HGTYTIVDGLAFTGVTLVFSLDQQNQTWMLGGTIDASIFDTAYTCAASITETATLRTIELSYKAAAPVTFIDLAAIGSLRGQSLQVLISKKLQQGISASTNSLSLGSGGYNWEVIATGGLTLTGLPSRLDGKLALYKQDS